MKDSYAEILKDKKRILVVFAHPDDLEIYCGATVARLVSDGKRVRSVKVSSGNKGSRQEKTTSAKLQKLREKEDSEAMRVLGIGKEDNIYLGVDDGSITNDIDIIEMIVKQIRLFKPDLIITHNPEDVIIRFSKNINWVNHRDHRNTGRSTIDAAYPYARDLLFFPGHFDNKKMSSHSVTEFLLVDYYEHPDLVAINVDNFHNIRTKAMAAHKSQYSLKHAQNSTDFFTQKKNGRFETFRHVVAD